MKGLGPGGAERLLGAAARTHTTGPEGFQIECAYVLPWKDHLVAELEAAGVRTHCLSTRRSDPTWPLALARLIRTGDYDVVHVHSPLPGSVARLAVRSIRPASARPGLVSTEHNRWETHRLPTRLLNRVTSRFDGAAFAVTDEVRDSMQGPVREHAVFLRHGIDVERVAAERSHRAELRAELGIRDDELVIGTVANFRPQKDYPNLLRAAQALLDRWPADRPTVRVVAVGQGPDEAAIRALHAELGLGDRVILTGFRDDAVRVLGACDVFTLASQWEGLPVAVMEALALGLPVVATAVGGMAEELTDEVNALLVPARDVDALAAAWARVLSDDGLRATLSAAARAKSAEYGVARTVVDIEAAYRCVARPRAAEASVPDAQHRDQSASVADLQASADASATEASAEQAQNRDQSGLVAGVQASAGAGATKAVERGEAAPGDRAGASVRDLQERSSGESLTKAAREGAPSSESTVERPKLEIRPAEAEDREQIITLLGRSLGSDGDPRYPQLFAWKHDENRFGPSPMWVATTPASGNGARIVAFRTLMRWEFVRGGQVIRAVRAVDTATDPDFQGQGLFRKLTMHGLEHVRAEGVDWVFNTPNSQSRPGYLKMGWRQVGRLPVAVRFVGPTGAAKALRSKVPAERWSTALPEGIGVPVADWLAGLDGSGSADDRSMAGGATGGAVSGGRLDPTTRLPAPRDVREIRTRVDLEFLRWRFGTPLLSYRAVEDEAWQRSGGETGAAIIVRARRRGEATELAVVARFGDSTATDRLAARTAADAGCTYAIRIGPPNPRAGFVPLPGNGPILTWRAVCDPGEPPLANWALTLGDVELF
jgi:glycosyltransferase involved in cell wall biosynthesis/GNAT superfamily N-acetyltransferase